MYIYKYYIYMTYIKSALLWHHLICYCGIRGSSYLAYYYSGPNESESEVAQSCPALCDPLDCSPPSSSVHGIFQTRILEWVATSFSRRSSQPRDWTWVSCIIGRCFTIWATREVSGPNSWPQNWPQKLHAQISLLSIEVIFFFSFFLLSFSS